MSRLSSGLFLISSLFCFFNAFSQDLVITSFSGASSYAQHEEIGGSFTISNEGIVEASGYIVCHIYVSSDSILDSSDGLVDASFPQALGPGQSQTVEIDYADIASPPGAYNLIFVADYYDVVEETDENNNVFLVQDVMVTEPNLDWRFSAIDISVDFPDTAINAGEYVYVSYNIENSGITDAAGRLQFAIYLSPDSILDASDTSVATENPFIYGPDDFSGVAYVEIPGVPAGIYYIFARIDSDSHFSETDEDNNVLATGRFTIQPADADLEAADMIIEWQGGYSMDVGVRITNHGTTGTAQYGLYGYLSSDQIFDPETDYALGRLDDDWQSIFVTPGDTITVLLYLYPSDYMIEPGAYYLMVDVVTDFPESGSAPNLIVSGSPEVVVEPPGTPAVALTKAEFTGVYDPTDQLFDLAVSFRNDGDPINGDIVYNLELRNASGDLVHQEERWQYLFMNNADSVSSTWTLSVTGGLPQGTYTLSIFSDSPSTTPYVEALLLVNEPIFRINGDIRGEDGVYIDQGKLFLYQKRDDGKVIFISKVAPTSSSAFAFDVDSHQHTLFFIPDRIAFPEYVPTILGKTVVLSESNFFMLEADTTVVFEILKVNSLAAGTRSVFGSVYQSAVAPAANNGLNAASRIRMLTEAPTAGYPVVLLNSQGEPVRVVTTDTNGYYSFDNLPDGIYQVVVALELDQAVMEEPVVADVTQFDAEVNFHISEIGTQPSVRAGQLITFDELPAKTFGDNPFNVAATSSSGLPVVMTSSDPTVAVFENGQIVIVGAGVTTIVATQAGNENYIEAQAVSRTLRVSKANQTITMEALPAKTLADEDFQINATASSGLPVSLESADPSIATIVNGKVHIVSTGTVVIHATQTGDDNYNGAPAVSQTLVITKVPQAINFAELPDVTFGDEPIVPEVAATSGLTVTLTSSNTRVASVVDGKLRINGAGSARIFARQPGDGYFSAAETVEQTIVVAKAAQTLTVDDIPAKTYGNPAFYITYQIAPSRPVTITSSDNTIASVSGTRVTIRRAGAVEITVTQPGDNNYKAVSVSRFLEIAKAPQAITFPELPEVTIGDGSIPLSASSTSFLTVTFTSDDLSVAEVGPGNVLFIHGPGTARITANQEGNVNFLPAAPVTREFTVNVVLGTEPETHGFHVSPNPTDGQVSVKSDLAVRAIDLYDNLGRRQPFLWSPPWLDIQTLASGVYFLRIVTPAGPRIIRLVRR